MLSIGSWIKKHRIKSILIAIGILLALVVPPFVVHWMFKTEASTTFWEYTWNAGDLITYIAGFEAFIGTVFLGLVAVRQNDKANELNEKLLIIQESQNVFERQPNVNLEAQVVFLKKITDIYTMLKCTFACKLFFDKDYFGADEKENGYMYLIKLHNTSGFRVIASLESLYLINDKESFYLQFENTPMIFRSYPLYIDNGEMEEIAFFLNYSYINNLNQVDGCIILTLINSIEERFILNISFELFGTPGHYLHMKILNYYTRKAAS